MAPRAPNWSSTTLPLALTGGTQLLLHPSSVAVRASFTARLLYSPDLLMSSLSTPLTDNSLHSFSMLGLPSKICGVIIVRCATQLSILIACDIKILGYQICDSDIGSLVRLTRLCCVLNTETSIHLPVPVIMSELT